MLSWGGEASIVCFAELCIFKKIIVIPDMSLVLAEEGRVLHLQTSAFPDVPPSLSSCQTSQVVVAELLRYSEQDLSLFQCFILFIKSKPFILLITKLVNLKTCLMEKEI